MKVKILSLAEEAKIIRREEKKKPPCREILYLHRVGVVRNASFEANIAYAFIRGKKMKDAMGAVSYKEDNLKYARGGSMWYLDGIQGNIARFGNPLVWVDAHKKRGLELPGKNLKEAFKLWILESYPGTSFSELSDKNFPIIKKY